MILLRNILFAVAILFSAMSAPAETTNTLSDAEIQGRALAQKIFEMQPAENSTNTGIVKIRDGTGKKLENRFEVQIKIGSSNWDSIYMTMPTNPSDKNEELWIYSPN